MYIYLAIFFRCFSEFLFLVLYLAWLTCENFYLDDQLWAIFRAFLNFSQ